MSWRSKLRLTSRSWNNANGRLISLRRDARMTLALFQGMCSSIVHPTYGSKPKMYSVPSGTAPDTGE